VYQDAPMLRVLAGLLVLLVTLSSGAQHAEAQPSAHAQAEALNEEGKALIGRVDLAGAAAKFREAVALVEDPRYVFNLCYALEKSGVLEEARRECKWVTTSRDRRLADKAAKLLASIEEQLAKKAALQPTPTPVSPQPVPTPQPAPAPQPAPYSAPAPAVAPGTPVPQHLLPYSMQTRVLDTSMHFGVRVGVGFSHFAGEYQEAGSVAAPSIGLMARKDLRKRLRATGEIQYAGRGSTVYAGDFDSIDIDVKYLDMSGGMQFALGGRFYIEAGATLSIFVSGEENRFFETDATFEISPIDLSGDLGFGAALGSFDLRFQYKHGLLDIADIEFSGENADAVGDDFSSRSYSFQLGYYF
tara:strand:- start:17774 stop:18844 length:1071 start_codon:yes stop_codon:yes gene_type:complete